MMKYSRIIILVLILISLNVSLFCIDFGMYIDNQTTFSTNEDTGLNQIDRITPWFTTWLSDTVTFSLAGNYTFEIDNPVLFDVDQLLLQGKWPFIKDGPSLFTLSLGRFLFSDFSKSVLNHNADGFKLSFSYPGTIISVGFGYTGLIPIDSSAIVLSKADTNDKYDAEIGEDMEIIFAPPRLLGQVELHLPDIIGGQDLYFSALFQKDVRPDNQVITEGEEDLPVAELNMGGFYDSIYAGTGLSGGIISSLYYNTYLYFETGRTMSYLPDDTSATDNSYQYKPVIAFLGGIGLNYFSEFLSFSRFGLEFVFASGDEDSISVIEGNSKGFSFLFTPISLAEKNIIYNPNLSNLFYIKGSYSIKPLALLNNEILENIIIMLDGTAFFRSTPSVAISDPTGINQNSKALYLGTEIDFVINFRPFSDIGTSFGTGYFIPYGGVLEDREFEFSLEFDLSISL